ncbi:MAG: helix-turn-helix transcriptional regulator [Gammaproteobacteria bacterium]
MKNEGKENHPQNHQCHPLSHHLEPAFADKRGAILMSKSLLSMKEVLALTRWSRSTLYNRMRDKEFGAPVHTGPRTRGWPADQVFKFIEECKAK